MASTNCTFFAPCSSSTPSPITMYTAFLPNLCIILSKQLSFPEQHKRRYIFLSGHTPQAEVIFRHRTWSYPLTDLAATFFAFFSNWIFFWRDPLHPTTVTSICFVSQGLASAASFPWALWLWCPAYVTSWQIDVTLMALSLQSPLLFILVAVKTWTCNPHRFKHTRKNRIQESPRPTLSVLVTHKASPSSFSTLDPSARVKRSQKCFCNRSNQTFLPAGCSWTSHK